MNHAGEMAVTALELPTDQRATLHRHLSYQQRCHERDRTPAGTGQNFTKSCPLVGNRVQQVVTDDSTEDNDRLMRPRPPRIAVTGAHMRFANTVADVVNVSPTGALIRLGFKPRLGGEWPLVLDLPAAGQVWLNGRVVRCQQKP